MDAATLTIFNHLFASVAEEMGVTLGRAAYSPNIKERLDYSCAVFLGSQRPALLAQAAHIPVHLGAMPASVRAAVAACAPCAPAMSSSSTTPTRAATTCRILPWSRRCSRTAWPRFSSPAAPITPT